MRKVWVPVIDFTNTKGIHITQTDSQATMVVSMHGKPKLGDDTSPEECESLSFVAQMTNEWASGFGRSVCVVSCQLPHRLTLSI